MPCFVYEYRDPRTNLPCYIGKGQRSRDKVHLKESHNKRLNRLIREIRKEGLEPILTRIADDLTCAQARNLEIELIAKYGRKGYEPGGILMNHTLGGEGASRRKVSLETKRKLRDSNLGQKRSEEACENIRRATQHYFDTHPEAGKEHSKRIKGIPCKEHVKEHLSIHFSEVRKGAGNPVAKTWEVRNPEGQAFITNELVQFCNKHKVSYVGLKASLKAKRPILKGASKGWQLVGIIP